MAKIDPTEPCPCGSGAVFGECHGRTLVNDTPRTISARIPLSVIPEPDPGTRAVFVKTGEGTIAFQGTATEKSFDCGSCGASLAIGVREDQMQGMVIKCNQCGTFNDTLSLGLQANPPTRISASIRVQNRVFSHEIIRLDFASYENCRFEHCTLIYSGYGPISMSGCSFGDVKWIFADAAENVLRFLTAMYHGGGEGGRQLVEQTFNTIRAISIRPT
jgi:DNA-directed RNA polymerase subunit RPC12/RpoP